MRLGRFEELLKNVDAATLLISLCFSKSTCTSYKEIDGVRHEVTESRYALAKFLPSWSGSWVVLFAFARPTVALFALSFRWPGVSSRAQPQ
jgi:hypothetical protein